MQKLGKVWLDSTFVGGTHDGLADGVESKNPAFQAVIEEDPSEKGRIQKGKNKKIADWRELLFP